MADINYDASSIFDFLPTFWADYEDRDILEAIYEAYLRLTDADYATLFTNDDNKDLTTLRSTRYQPIAYQKFDDWEVLQSKHNHFYYSGAWPSATNGKYVVRIPNTVLGNINMIFADTSFVPSFLYSITEDWWVSGNVVVRGTVLSFDEAKLLRYFTTSNVDSSLCYTNSTSSPDINFNALRICAFNPREVIVEETDGETTEYLFDSEYDLYTSTVKIEFWDITDQVTVDYNEEEATITVPALLAQNSRGYVELDDGTIEAVNIQPTITVTVGLTARVSRVRVYANFDLRDPLVLSGNTVTLTKGTFVPGSQLIVRSGGKASTSTIPRPLQRITTNCGDLSDSSEVLYFGTNLVNFEVRDEVTQVDQYGQTVTLDQRLRFNRPLAAGATLKIIAAKEEAHTHGRVQATPESNPALPIDLGTSITKPESAFVFLNGVYLVPTTDYTFPQDDQIDITAATTVFDVVDIYYEIPGTQQAHVHRNDKIVLSDATTQEFFFKNTNLETIPDLVFGDSLLLQDDFAVATSDTRITFKDPIAARTLYSVFYTTYGRQYKHLIPYVEEPEWGYRGRLKSAETLSNGIENPSMTLSSNQFDLVKENGKLYLLTDVRMDEGWWGEVYFDDHALQDLWADILGITGESEASFARVVGAIVAAARSSSSAASFENFGSMLLGSATTTAPGYFGGVTFEENGTVLNIIPEDPGQAAYTLPVNTCAPIRAPEQGCIPTGFAINQLVSVVDLADNPPTWLALVTETLSDTFRATDRLDQSTTRAITSVPFSFDNETKILTDYSIDYKDLGIVSGDLVKVNFGFVIADTQESSDTVFALVERVINKNQLVLRVDLEVIATGYGEEGYGENPYGGAILLRSFISSYTIWGRDRTRLDTGFRLDNFNPNTLDRVSELMGAFNFGVEVDWSAMTDTFTVESLGKLIDIAKPADTQAFVFTNAFADACSTALQDTMNYGLSEAEPELTFPANVYSSENSFISMESVIDPSVDTEYAGLYEADCPVFGALVRAVIPDEDPDPQAGEYYITHTGFRENSVFADLYSAERGLENTLLLVEEDPILAPELRYISKSNLGRRQARGLKLATDAHIDIADTSSTGKLQPTPTSLAYTSGTAFTINTWVALSTDEHTVGTDAVLFEWGPIKLAFTYLGSGLYTPRAATYEATPLDSTRDVVAGRAFLMSVVYQQPPGQSYYQTTIYINGSLVATSPSTDPPTTTIANFSGPAVLGWDLANTDGQAFNSTLFSFDFRTEAMTAQDLATYFSEQTLPDLGMDGNDDPIVFANALMTYQFHSYWPDPTVPDYSGNAFNGTFVGTADYAYNTVLTEMASVGDCYIITTYDTLDNLSTQNVPRFAAYNPTATLAVTTDVFTPTGTLRAGGGTFDNNLLTLSRDGVTYSVPNVAYCLDSDGTWSRFFPDVVCPSASLDYDATDLFTGFVV